MDKKCKGLIEFRSGHHRHALRISIRSTSGNSYHYDFRPVDASKDDRATPRFSGEIKKLLDCSTVHDMLQYLMEHTGYEPQALGSYSNRKWNQEGSNPEGAFSKNGKKKAFMKHVEEEIQTISQIDTISIQQWFGDGGEYKQRAMNVYSDKHLMALVYGVVWASEEHKAQAKEKLCEYVMTSDSSRCVMSDMYGKPDFRYYFDPEMDDVDLLVQQIKGGEIYDDALNYTVLEIKTGVVHEICWFNLSSRISLLDVDIESQLHDIPFTVSNEQIAEWWESYLEAEFEERERNLPPDKGLRTCECSVDFYPGANAVSPDQLKPKDKVCLTISEGNPYTDSLVEIHNDQGFIGYLSGGSAYHVAKLIRQKVVCDAYIQSVYHGTEWYVTIDVLNADGKSLCEMMPGEKRPSPKVIFTYPVKPNAPRRQRSSIPCEATEEDDWATDLDADDFDLELPLDEGDLPLPAGETWMPFEEVTFGKYPCSKSGKNGAIKWLVLWSDENTKLLISKEILDFKQYHSDITGITWQDCDLRKWLNEDFFRTAFTKEEQTRIVEVETPNDVYESSCGDNPLGYSLRGYAKPTHDRVHLLSYREANDLFGERNELMCKPSKYAESRTNPIAKNPQVWWTRSKADIYQTRAICANGAGDNAYINMTLGVRPIICIAQSSIKET